MNALQRFAMIASSTRQHSVFSQALTVLNSLDSNALCRTAWNRDVCLIQTRNFAARKGTRERKLKLQRARKLLLQAQAAQKEAETDSRRKVTKMQVSSRLRTNMNETMPYPEDDVWLMMWSKKKLENVSEAIQMHRESHHPTMMNLPDAILYLSLELNMKLGKKNKYVDNFAGVVKLPHYFDDGKQKTVIAFCKDDAQQQKAIDAGVDMVGGIPLIKRVQGGEALLSDYKYVVAHVDIIQELGSLRGILKRKYPVASKGTLGVDMFAMVEQFKKGIEYVSDKDTVKIDFGWVDVPVGPLSMPTEHLQENIDAIVKAVCTHRSPTLGHFVTVALLTCPPSKEKIIIDVSQLFPQPPQRDEDDDDEAVAN